MKHSLRICIVGGGSYNWSPTIISDLALTPGVSGVIVLHDFDESAASDIRALGQRIVEATGAPLTFEVNASLRNALTDADFVVVTITTGGFEATKNDIEIPARYRIAQSVGDTVGPGGLMRGLRNVPVLIDIARTMEQVCPNAWLLNLTNPMTTLVRAVTKITSIKTIGLCHEVFGARRVLTTLFAGDGEALDYRLAGINHCIWLLDARVGTRDALSLLQAHLLNGGTIPLKPFTGAHMAPFQDRWTLKLALFDIYGALPAAGDRHLAEFFPTFLDAASGHGAAYDIRLTTVEHRQRMTETARARTRSIVAGDRAWAPEHSEEEVADIIAAIAAGRSHRAVMNLPNTGQIENLPRDAVVETLGTVGASGAHGLPAGRLPPGIQGVVLPHLLNQEMIVEAAMTGDRQLALQALINDPLTRDFRTAPAMFNELLQAHAAFLPQFRL